MDSVNVRVMCRATTINKSVEKGTSTTAVAAGGMLAMIVDTMIPEAVAEAHDWARRFVVLGFLVSFALTKLAG